MQFPKATKKLLTLSIYDDGPKILGNVLLKLFSPSKLLKRITRICRNIFIKCSTYSVERTLNIISTFM